MQDGNRKNYVRGKELNGNSAFIDQLVYKPKTALFKKSI